MKRILNILIVLLAIAGICSANWLREGLSGMERLKLEEFEVQNLAVSRQEDDFPAQLDIRLSRSFMSDRNREMLEYLRSVAIPAENQLHFAIFENQDALRGREYIEERRVGNDRKVKVKWRIGRVEEKGVVLELAGEKGTVSSLTPYGQIPADVSAAMLEDVLLKYRDNDELRIAYLAHSYFTGKFLGRYEEVAREMGNDADKWIALREWCGLSQRQRNFRGQIVRMVNNAESRGPLRTWTTARLLLNSDLASALGCDELLFQVCRACAPYVPEIIAGEMVREGAAAIACRDYLSGAEILLGCRAKFGRLDFPEAGQMGNLLETALANLPEDATGVTEEDAARMAAVYEGVKAQIEELVKAGMTAEARTIAESYLKWNFPACLSYYGRLQMLLAGIRVRAGEKYALEEGLAFMQAANCVTPEELRIMQLASRRDDTTALSESDDAWRKWLLGK